MKQLKSKMKSEQYLLERRSAKVPLIKALTEMNAKNFNSNGTSTENLSFKANKSGKATFFRREDLDSVEKTFRVVSLFS